jgi:hypothetical protein
MDVCHLGYVTKWKKTTSSSRACVLDLWLKYSKEF